MERIMKFIVGDWSGDGHGVSETFLAKLIGEDARDISDEVLQKRLNDMIEETGVNFFDLFEDMDNDTIYDTDLEALKEAGFIVDDNSPRNGFREIYVNDDDDEIKVIDLRDLLEFYFGVEFVPVDEDEIPLLFGGAGRVKNPVNGHSSFGYGLYN